eukprot:jgi/Psemu1/3194/gm1.3194_g
MVAENLGTQNPLYGCNVVNYKTIKKCMVVYQEILVWYMENVIYAPTPENMEKGLCFYTKRDEGSLHNSRNYIARNVKVIFKESDLEILYPTFEIGEAVYVGDKSNSGLVYDYVLKQYKHHEAYPGYKLLFKPDDGKGTVLRFPFFEVSPSTEQGCPIDNIPDLVQLYGKKCGKDEISEGGNKVKEGQSHKVKRNNKAGNSSGNSSSSSSSSSPSNLISLPDNDKYNPGSSDYSN